MSVKLQVQSYPSYSINEINKQNNFILILLFHNRSNYRSYCQLYEKMLLDPSNSEIKIDLQQIEDTLDIANVIIAREQTKLRVSIYIS